MARPFEARMGEGNRRADLVRRRGKNKLKHYHLEVLPGGSNVALVRRGELVGFQEYHPLIDPERALKKAARRVREDREGNLSLGRPTRAITVFVGY